MAYNYITVEADYDISKYNVLDTMMLFYVERINRFVDPFGGEIVHDIHRLLKPWQIELFKSNKTDYTFPDITNSFLIDLVYPDYLHTKHS